MREATPNERWRFQFGISTLLVLTVASAVGISQGKRWYAEPHEIEIPAYSAARLEAARSEGRVVLVHLKADWSNTDALVRRQVLTEAFRRTLESRKVTMLQWDVTNLPEAPDSTMEDLVSWPHIAGDACVGIYPRGPRDRDPIIVCPALKQEDILQAVDRASHWP